MVLTCSIDMPSLVAICRRTATRGEKWVFFVCLFVCLSRLRSVYLWTIGALTYRSILMQFSAFLGRKNTLSNFSKICILHHKMAPHLRWNYIKIRKLLKVRTTKFCARLRPFRKRIEKKFHHSLLAQVL